MRTALLVVGAYKLYIILCASLAIQYGQFDVDQWQLVKHWPPNLGHPTLASRFGTWDSAHYILLANTGYEAGSPSCAFYPILPWALSPLQGHEVGILVWGLILCNLASVAGLLLVFDVFRTFLPV